MAVIVDIEVIGNLIHLTSTQITFTGKCKAKVADTGYGCQSTDDVQGNCTVNLNKENKIRQSATIYILTPYLFRIDQKILDRYMDFKYTHKCVHNDGKAWKTNEEQI